MQFFHNSQEFNVLFAAIFNQNPSESWYYIASGRIILSYNKALYLTFWFHFPTYIEHVTS